MVLRSKFRRKVWIEPWRLKAAVFQVAESVAVEAEDNGFGQEENGFGWVCGLVCVASGNTLQARQSSSPGFGESSEAERQKGKAGLPAGRGQFPKQFSAGILAPPGVMQRPGKAGPRRIPGC